MWGVAATQRKGRLSRWDGRQAGFLEEVVLDRALRQVVARSQK